MKNLEFSGEVAGNSLSSSETFGKVNQKSEHKKSQAFQTCNSSRSGSTDGADVTSAKAEGAAVPDSGAEGLWIGLFWTEGCEGLPKATGTSGVIKALAHGECFPSGAAQRFGETGAAADTDSFTELKLVVA